MARRGGFADSGPRSAMRTNSTRETPLRGSVFPHRHHAGTQGPNRHKIIPTRSTIWKKRRH